VGFLPLHRKGSQGCSSAGLLRKLHGTKCCVEAKRSQGWLHLQDFVPFTVSASAFPDPFITGKRGDMEEDPPSPRALEQNCKCQA
jgi:hypothetical protein